MTLLYDWQKENVLNYKKELELNDSTRGLLENLLLYCENFNENYDSTLTKEIIGAIIQILKRVVELEVKVYELESFKEDKIKDYNDY